MAKAPKYPTAPVVPAKQIAGANPVGRVDVGASTPTILPARMEVNHAFNVAGKRVRGASLKGVHGFGHVAKNRQGHLRMSGSSTAHRVGKK